jgi:hypothetical protein
LEPTRPVARKQALTGVGEGLSVAFAFVATGVLFALGGVLLDRWLGTDPVLAAVLAGVGFTGGFLRLVYADKYEAARRAKLGISPPPQRQAPAVLADRARHKTASVAFKPRRFGDPVPEDLAARVAARREAEGTAQRVQGAAS